MLVHTGLSSRLNAQAHFLSYTLVTVYMPPIHALHYIPRALSLVPREIENITMGEVWFQSMQGLELFNNTAKFPSKNLTTMPTRGRNK